MNKQISKIENVSIYFINLLNISIEDELTMIDMLQELEVIEDLNSFRIFVKRRFNYEKFRFFAYNGVFEQCFQKYLNTFCKNIF